MATSIAIFAQLPGIDPNEKVLSDAKKQAKSLAKEGWKVMNGGMDMASQIDVGMKAAYVLMEGLDGEPTQRYILATSEAKMTNENKAKSSATSLCKSQIINSLRSHVEGMVDYVMKNRQLSTTEAETKEEMTSRMMSYAKETLMLVRPILYIVKKEGNEYKARVQIAYDLEKIKASILK